MFFLDKIGHKKMWEITEDHGLPYQGHKGWFARSSAPIGQVYKLGENAFESWKPAREKALRQISHEMDITMSKLKKLRERREELK